jgi:HlyD family secretion protein
MKRILPILVLLVVVAAGYAAWTSQKSANAATATLGGSGTIEAVNVSVSAQTSGRIVESHVKTGDPVEKGQVLFKLDPTLANDQVAQAEAGVRAAQATLKSDQDNSKSDAQIAQDNATLDQANLQVKMAQVQAGYCVVRSPLNGVAMDVPANVGENANPGSALAIIGDVRHLTVSVYVSEAQIAQVKVGQTGTLTTDSTGGKTFDCKVTSVASQAEFTPASIETKDQRVKLVYEVKLDVSDTSGQLKPGMPADVKL